MTDVETVIAARDIAVAAVTTTAANVDLATQQADRAEVARDAAVAPTAAQIAAVDADAASAFRVQQDARLTNTIEAQVLALGGFTVFYGSTAGTARPATSTPVTWVGYEGTLPSNAADFDVIIRLDITPPAVPTDLIAVAGSGSGEVDLTWTDPTDSDLAGIGIYVDGTLVTTVAPGIEAYTRTGLTNGTEYDFTIDAVDTSTNRSAETGIQSATPVAVPLTYDQQVAAFAPMIYLKLNETSGTTASDSSGNARHGTIAGPTLATSGATFDGTNDSIYVADSPTVFSGLNAGSLVVELTAAVTGETGYPIFIGKPTPTTGSSASVSPFMLIYDKDSDTVKAQRGNGNATTRNNATVEYAPDGTEKHVVFTWDGAMHRLYVNGVEVDSAAATYSSLAANTDPLCLGGPNPASGATATAFSQGTMRRVQVYNHVLSDSDVAALYAARAL